MICRCKFKADTKTITYKRDKDGVLTFFLKGFRHPLAQAKKSSYWKGTWYWEWLYLSPGYMKPEMQKAKSPKNIVKQIKDTIDMIPEEHWS